MLVPSAPAQSCAGVSGGMLLDMRYRLGLPALLVLSLVLAACGGPNGPSAVTSTGVTAPTTQTAPTPSGATGVITRKPASKAPGY